MRIANYVGAALVAACVTVMAGSPAMAETTSAAAAADSDVSDIQESAENPDEIDSGEAPAKAPNAYDAAEVGAFVVTECDPGYSMWSWTGKKTPWTVTHAKGFENYTDTTATYTKQATRERTITASATVSSGANVAASVIIASLDGQVSYSLAASGTVTNTGSESVTATMKPSTTYVFYAGARKTSGAYTNSVCNSRGSAMNIRSKGSATSFGLKREGAVKCGSRVSNTTLGYFAERDYC